MAKQNQALLSVLAELETAKAYVARLELTAQTLRELEAKSEHGPPSDTTPEPPPKRGNGRKGGKRSRTKQKQVLDAARDVLREQSPMHLNQLCEAILNTGVKIGGSNPRNYLGALLSGRKTEFVTERGVGWRLRKSEGPAIGVAEPSHLNGAAG